MQLLLGCGFRRAKLLGIDGRQEWDNLYTVDLNAACRPDEVRDLEKLPYDGWPDDWAEEIHAYDVLEHLGAQGDFRFFFGQWAEFWRVLRKPNGYFFGIVPSAQSPWAWGDPGHRRLITPESLAFLDARMYDALGSSPVSDYRELWRHDLRLRQAHDDGTQFRFVLEALP